MTITAKNSREVYIVMVVIFAIGVIWNIYYVHRIADERERMLMIENHKINHQVNTLNTLLDSARLHNYELAKKYINLSNVIRRQSAMIEQIEDNYNEHKSYYDNEYNESNYIPDANSAEQINYLSGYRYEAY